MKGHFAAIALILSAASRWPSTSTSSRSTSPARPHLVALLPIALGVALFLTPGDRQP